MIDQEEIHNQCLSEDPEERIKALEQLKNNFSLLPDKQKVWDDLHRLTTDEDTLVRHEAASALGFFFCLIPDKLHMYYDLHRLTNDKDHYVRFSAASTLGSTFSYMPDKKQAWEDLLKLTSDEEAVVRLTAAEALYSAFNDLSDKKQAWDDLHRLTNDGDCVVRSRAAYAIGSAFYQIPDKQQAWEDLHRLTNDKDWRGRAWAVSAIRLSFLHIPDKQQAWSDLHRLTEDEHSSVKSSVASAIGSASSYLLNKEQVLDDLYMLTIDQDANVRVEATSSLGFMFSDIVDKQQVWDNLQRLSNDEDKWVKAYANFVLGKVSIFKASQAENEDYYRDKLEMGIEFFEKSSKESPLKELNPSNFCLPFYRSFYTLIFKKQEAKREVDKYLAEAKSAVKGSKSKRLLFEAVNNLAKALKEVQSLENLDLETKKCELDFYRKYCDRASELMKDTEETAPYAIAAMKKGLPILDNNLRELIEEIQKKAEIINEQTKGTQFEQLGDELSQSSQSLSFRDLVGFKKQVNIMQNTLRVICSKFPEGQKGEACELLEMMYREPSIEDKVPLIVNILSKLSYQLDITAHLNRIEEKLDQKLDSIRFDIFKIKLNSHNVISSLDSIKKELEKLNQIEGLNALSIERLSSTQADKLNDLNKNLLERFKEMETLVNKLPNNKDTKEIIDLLNELKQSDPDILLQRSSGITSLIGFVVLLAQLYQQYKPV